MSRITLAPNPAGTGTLTVAAPNTNTDRTITLPDVTTTLVGTDATQTLTNKSIAASQLTGALPAIDGSALTNLPAPAQLSTADGSAPSYSARAWVIFAGASGTVSGSGNVTSVSRSAVGTYTINFTTAMPDANYCITGVSSGSTSGSTSISGAGASGDFSRSTGSVTVYSVDASGNANVDAVTVCVAIFR